MTASPHKRLLMGLNKAGLGNAHCYQWWAYRLEPLNALSVTLPRPAEEGYRDNSPAARVQQLLPSQHLPSHLQGVRREMMRPINLNGDLLICAQSITGSEQVRPAQYLS